MFYISGQNGKPMHIRFPNGRVPGNPPWLDFASNRKFPPAANHPRSLH